MALAQYQFAKSQDRQSVEKAVLDQDHFEEVCKMAKDFKQYLKELHKKDESGRARIAKNYYDN